MFVASGWKYWYYPISSYFPKTIFALMIQSMGNETKGWQEMEQKKDNRMKNRAGEFKHDKKMIPPLSRVYSTL